MDNNKISVNRVGKEKLVEAFGADIKDAGIVVVVQQLGLNASETRALRVLFRKEDIGFKVGKNTLIKIAVKGTKLEPLAKMLRGPTALAYSKDPIAAARVAVEFAKKNDKLKIVGAVMGDSVLNEAQTKALASLPSLDQLRGKIVGLLVAPATKIACVLQAPAGQLARVMSAKSKLAA
ncbi:MAG: 50S ribosomal protein L10 [Bdellovibrionales bacterium]